MEGKREVKREETVDAADADRLLERVREQSRLRATRDCRVAAISMEPQLLNRLLAPRGFRRLANGDSRALNSTG